MPPKEVVRSPINLLRRESCDFLEILIELIPVIHQRGRGTYKEGEDVKGARRKDLCEWDMVVRLSLDWLKVGMERNVFGYEVGRVGSDLAST